MEAALNPKFQTVLVANNSLYDTDLTMAAFELTCNEVDPRTIFRGWKSTLLSLLTSPGHYGQGDSGTPDPSLDYEALMFEGASANMLCKGKENYSPSQPIGNSR